MRWCGDRGFSLVEALVTTLLLMLLVSGILGVLQPAYGMFLVQPERQDLQQRLRAAVEMLAHDLGTAGAGPALGPLAGPLLRHLPPVLPYRLGERHSDPGAGVFHRPDVVTALHVPPDAPVALVDGYTVQGTAASIDTGACLTATGLCRFATDMRVLLVDAAGRTAFATISLVDPAVLTVEGRYLDANLDPATAIVAQVQMDTYARGWDAAGTTPRLTREGPSGVAQPAVDHVVDLAFEYDGEPVPPALLSGGTATTYGPAPPPVGVDDARDTWPAGENCLFAVAGGVHVPRLPALGPGGMVPLPAAMLTDGPWCPDAGSPTRFDADLLRVRMVTVALRLQVGPATMRGPAGPRFRIAGQGRNSARLVPDEQVRFHVAPPNLRAAP